MEKEFDFLIRLVIVGEPCVGKSTVIQRYSKGDFIPYYVSTIGVDFFSKVLNVDGKNVKIQVWDTAGQERFRTITKSYYRKTAGIILMFDVSKEESFDKLSYWLADIEKFKEPSAKVLLIGNKSDLEKRVSQSKIEQLCDVFKLNYLETSAKLNKNIDQIFIDIIRGIINSDNLNELVIPNRELEMKNNNLECCSIS